jgi:hypothetical protein
MPHYIQGTANNQVLPLIGSERAAHGIGRIRQRLAEAPYCSGRRRCIFTILLGEF